MKVTYTAEDGTHFDSEADCLGWERFCKLREATTSTVEMTCLQGMADLERLEGDGLMAWPPGTQKQLGW